MCTCVCVSGYVISVRGLCGCLYVPGFISVCVDKYAINLAAFMGPFLGAQ